MDSVCGVQVFRDSKGNKQAILIKQDYKADGIYFLTEDTDFFQMACMGHPAGHTIVPHYHNKIERIGKIP